MSEENKGKLIIKKRSLAIVLILTLFIGGIGGAFFFRAMVGSDQYAVVSVKDLEAMNKVYGKYAKLEMLYQHLDSHYYKELDQEEMMTGIIKDFFPVQEIRIRSI